MCDDGDREASVTPTTTDTGLTGGGSGTGTAGGSGTGTTGGSGTGTSGGSGTLPSSGSGGLPTGGSASLPTGGSASGGSGSGSGTPCFVAGTPVATPDGPRPIEALRVGDRVLAHHDGATVLRRIRRLHHGRSAALVDLWTASAEVVGVTPGHAFLDPGTGRWRNAADLAPGHLVRVRTADGERTEPVLRVERRVVADPVAVYNLSLSGPGGFYAAGLVASQKRGVAPVVAAAPRAIRAPMLAAVLLATACGGDGKDATSTPDTPTLDVADADADTDADADADTDADTDTGTPWVTNTDVVTTDSGSTVVC
jgi:hypothetical protein